MPTEVKHYNGGGMFSWFTVTTQNEHKVYFHGRYWYVSRRLEHYVHPNAHSLNFSAHTVCVQVYPHPYFTEITRFSQFTFTAKP